MKTIVLAVLYGVFGAFALVIGAYSILRSDSSKRLDRHDFDRMIGRAKDQVTDTVETVKSKVLSFKKPAKTIPAVEILVVDEEMLQAS